MHLFNGFKYARIHKGECGASKYWVCFKIITYCSGTVS